MTILADRALLISVNVRMWSGRKIDKAETTFVIARHRAASKAARVSKDLLPEAKSLQAVHKHAGEIRTFVYKNTLPWSDGVRILRADGYMKFVAEFQAQRDKYQRLVKAFISEYPQLRSIAAASDVGLGSLFNDEDYPEAVDLSDKFGIDLNFMPVPTGDDWRVDLSDQHIADLKSSVEKQVQVAQKAAMKEVFERIYDVASKAHERLSDPRAIFRDSLIENAVNLCEVLPSLNLTDDPRVEQLRKKISSTLGAQDPARLRKDPAARQKTAAAMKDVMNKMNVFMGA